MNFVKINDFAIKEKQNKNTKWCLEFWELGWQPDGERLSGVDKPKCKRVKKENKIEGHTIAFTG